MCKDIFLAEILNFVGKDFLVGEIGSAELLLTQYLHQKSGLFPQMTVI